MPLPVDPAGLLERVPELAELTSVPSVRRAIERGDPHAVYRALSWVHLFGKLKEHGPVVRELLRRRRLFLKPITGSPLLSTVNGIGATVYGSSDRDPADGSYLTAHFFVFVFVPIFPLSQYLVFDAEGDRRAWHFIGKVPLGPVLYAWRSLFSLGVVGAVLWAALSAFVASRHNEVQVLNGLPVPVRVSIAGHNIDLGPEGRAQVDLDVGPHPLEVHTKDGALIERASFDVTSGTELLAWNVAGAAPLYLDKVTYSAVPGDQAGQEPQVSCGQQRVAYESVDYAFVAPPKTLDVGSKDGTLVKTVADVAPGGAQACVLWLSRHGRSQQALPIADRIADLNHYDARATAQAAALREQVLGQDAAIRWVQGLRDKHADVVDLHRVYQDFMERAGKREVVRAEYRERAQKLSEDPDAAYLYARLLRREESIKALRELLTKNPEHMLSLRSLVHQEARAHAFAEAVEHWKMLSRVDSAQALAQSDNAALAHVGLGNSAEALDILRRRFAGLDPGDERVHTSLLYARIGFGAGDSDPLALQRKLGAEASAPLNLMRTRVRVGAEVPRSDLSIEPDEAVRLALELTWLAARDPDGALKLLSESPRAAAGIEGLDAETWTLLFAEASRREPNGKAATLLAAAPSARPALVSAFKDYLNAGVRNDDIDELEPAELAALELVRSRRAELASDEREQLRQLSQADALPYGVVHKAVSSWTP